MERLPRKLISWTVGILAFLGGYLFLLPAGCDDVEGVPSWERCTSLMGLPAFSFEDWGLSHLFDILIPLAVGVLAGVITWWLLGLSESDSP